MVVESLCLATTSEINSKNCSFAHSEPLGRTPPVRSRVADILCLVVCETVSAQSIVELVFIYRRLR